MARPFFSHPMIFNDESIGFLNVGAATGETTDATVTAIREVAGFVDDRMVFVQAIVTARRTGGSAGTANDSAGYFITAAFKRSGGVVTQVGVTSTLSVEEDQGSWDVNWDTTGGIVRLTVKGAANNTVSWRATMLVQFA